MVPLPSPRRPRRRNRGAAAALNADCGEKAIRAMGISDADAVLPGPETKPVGPPTILRAGRNCREVAWSDRASPLVDGAAYFASLEQALRNARRSILIVGWDFDGRIRLRQDVDAQESPPLGDLLRRLVEQRDDLSIRILIWSTSVIHAPGDMKQMLFGAPWRASRGIVGGMPATRN